MTGKVVIGAGAAGFNFLPIFIAQHEGFFARHGVEVEVRRTGSTDAATKALLDGDLQIAITPPEGAIANYLQGGPLRIVAGHLNGLPLTLIANPAIKSIAELKGKSLGTSSMTEGTAIYTMEILKRNGLEYPGDYEFSIVGVHTARWAALQEGTLDAALQLIPLNFVAEDAGYSVLGEASDYIPEIAFISIIADSRWATANRDLLSKTLAGIRSGLEAMHDPANDALSVHLLQEVVKTEPKFIQRSLDLIRSRKMMPVDMSLPIPALGTSIRLMRQAGLMPQSDLSPERVFDDDYLAAVGQ
jgi:NitT/TauT family transport system substrate-binding protein